MGLVKSSNLGYPRIGEKREWKKLLESYWAGKVDEAIFHSEMKRLRLHFLEKQKRQGLDWIPVGDFSLYDHVLDTAFMFGLIPERFQLDVGDSILDTYFAIARGSQDAVASEMTKWFNTNYHYIVPELQGLSPQLKRNRPLDYYREAKNELGIQGKPVLLGPITFLKLSKGYDEDELDTWLDRLGPLYAQVLNELESEGVQWVQIDEPILVQPLDEKDFDRFYRVYDALNEATPKLNILLQTYFEAVEDYEKVVQLPVQGIGLDFVHDQGINLAAVSKQGFPKDKVLAAGVIDGRNIWRANLQEKLELIHTLTQVVALDRLVIQPSSSLLHVPVTVKNEEALEPLLKNALSYADEKLEEVVLLTETLNEGTSELKKRIQESVSAVTALNQSSARNNHEVQQEIDNLGEALPTRPAAYQERRVLQAKRFNLPLLPTTTIGSLPQTPEVRQARQKWRRREWSDEAYEQFVKDEIKRWVKIQEEIGLDVLVHGEFERNDMVEYFGEKLIGYTTAKHAWVQSYGSRCVKPPIVYGDVSLDQPMTVKESVYTQSLTDRPVKGMLTGPVTILNWSFVRDDIPRSAVQNQIALALRKEIEALEANGIAMIQVDEPALREGLPLKPEKWQDYLDKAVYAFRLATATVENETQIHTHMCYAEFQDILESISQLDADVISIEAARSHGELVNVFEEQVYDKEIGLGVYDIHSPRVPGQEEMAMIVDRALEVLAPEQFWINPDCGLKTRKEAEVIPALEAMVEAAKQLREKYSVKQ
ncbi:5-methyltetrahydropteroyltriglutamate--homocysteine methyltransferase [Pullulanibacillus camelliae]|uniref:5-methyltetrahydropteroyltriglutamate--homocysteine methyltransferase n=1 Tax=Pullulanibacillus camelliae TaxID=1707096 RepID=A0A8J2VKL2_9BACL|nr:5-methyltetrahydropteroyltriglutamate--homocysteine S-methyltransferase [Pullulanibacillus camelliae]GGE28483.1 5-methyltetrahydropteroyltriglutamate--homocysteine methyltransferase [Pullulanibacillus camelliae]